MTTERDSTMSSKTTTATDAEAAATTAGGQDPAQDGPETGADGNHTGEGVNGPQNGSQGLASEQADGVDLAALAEAANRVMPHLGRATPLGRLLTDAAAVRENARGRLIALGYARQQHRATDVTAEAEHHLAFMRDRARTAARDTLEQVAVRLCGVGGTARLTPQDAYLVGQAAAKALEGVTDDAGCTAALSRAMRASDSAFRFAVAGAIARHALEHDHDGALAIWCQAGGPGAGSRGGMAAVETWRAARTVQRALVAGAWPSPLTAAPTLEDVA